MELRWAAFFTRVMAGLLFGMAGYFKVFVMTTRGHAEKYFTGPYADSWIPHPLLWLLGVSIPFLELIAGWLLVAGWFRRPTAVALGFLLLVVTYGHALKEPLFNVNSHIIPRLLLLLPTWMLSAADDPLSVDGWLAGRKKREP